MKQTDTAGTNNYKIRIILSDKKINVTLIRSESCIAYTFPEAKSKTFTVESQGVVANLSPLELHRTQTIKFGSDI